MKNQKYDDGDRFDEKKPEGSEGRFLYQIHVMRNIFLDMVTDQPCVDRHAKAGRGASIIRHSEDEDLANRTLIRISHTAEKSLEYFGVIFIDLSLMAKDPSLNNGLKNVELLFEIQCLILKTRARVNNITIVRRREARQIKTKKVITRYSPSSSFAIEGFFCSASAASKIGSGEDRHLAHRRRSVTTNKRAARAIAKDV